MWSNLLTRWSYAPHYRTAAFNVIANLRCEASGLNFIEEATGLLDSLGQLLKHSRHFWCWQLFHGLYALNWLALISNFQFGFKLLYYCWALSLIRSCGWDWLSFMVFPALLTITQLYSWCCWRLGGICKHLKLLATTCTVNLGCIFD